MPKSSYDAARAGKRALAITAAVAMALTGAAFGTGAAANAVPIPPPSITAPLDSLSTWTESVPDSSVPGSSYDYGLKTVGGNSVLRYSNWVADPVNYGAIAQLSTPIVQDAGEPSSGAANNTFTQEFTLGSEDYAGQPGLAIEVDANKGDNRAGGNLLLREDSAGTLTLSNFFMKPDATSDADDQWQNVTASVPFTHPVNIKYVDHFIAGGRDIVKVYVDDVLKLTGSTFEGYNDVALGSKQTVNSMLIRTGYRKAVDGGWWSDATPTTDELTALKGKGFDFSNITVASSNTVTVPTPTTTKSIELSNIGTEDPITGYPSNDIFVGAPLNSSQHPTLTGVTDGTLGLGAATQILHAYPADARPTDLTGLIDSGLAWNQDGTGASVATFQIPLTYGDTNTFTTLRPASAVPGDNTANWDQNWVSSHGGVTGTLGQLVSTIEQAGNVHIFGFGVFGENPVGVNSIQAGTTKYTFADSKQITISKPIISGTTGPDVQSVGGTPRVGDTLTAIYDVTSPQSTAGQTVAYQWYAGSSPIPAVSHGTSATYTVPSKRIGLQLSVRVTVAKAGELSAVATSAKTPKVVAGVFANATVGITGVGAVGSRETAVVSSIPTATSVSYRWYRGSTPIYLATRSTYALTAADLGKVITVRATLAKTGYTSKTVSSTDSVTVTLGVLHLNPTITGTVKVGKTLTAHSGSTVSGQTVYYIWYSDNTGKLLTQPSKSPTYKIPTSIVGQTIVVEVLVYADGYGSEFGYSDPTAAVVN